MVNDLCLVNFAIAPTALPVEEIIAGTEVVAKYIYQRQRQTNSEGRLYLPGTIKRVKLPKSNINKREKVALQTLKKTIPSSYSLQIKVESR